MKLADNQPEFLKKHGLMLYRIDGIGWPIIAIDKKYGYTYVSWKRTSYCWRSGSDLDARRVYRNDVSHANNANNQIRYIDIDGVFVNLSLFKSITVGRSEYIPIPFICIQVR